METPEARLAIIEEKIDHIKRTTDRLYKIFLIAVIVTVLSAVLPLIAMGFILPQVMGAYSSALGL